jgi:hypothetical protein
MEISIDLFNYAQVILTVQADPFSRFLRKGLCAP